MAHTPQPDPPCLVLERVAEDIFEPEFVADAPLVRFEAFASRSRIFGWLRLTADRLTDLLNLHEHIRLLHPEIEDLDTGETRAVDDLVIARREILAVNATGPRGNETLRLRTKAYPVAAQAGSFLIGGHVHAIPGSPPLVTIPVRPPMVPLTDAWIEYWADGRRRRQWVGTIIVNRERADWIREVALEDLAFGQLRHLETA